MNLFEIIEEKQHFLAINKSAGVLVQSDKQGAPGIQEELWAKHGRNLHILNRLDRPVSGLVLLSRSRAFTKHYIQMQASGGVKKTYIGIVEGLYKLEPGNHIHFLRQDKDRRKAVEDETHMEKNKAVIFVSLLEQLENYSIVELGLESGSFHQIRAQLSAMRHPIKGDVKYGARRGNRDRSIYLHSYSQAFELPGGERVQIKAPLPENDTLWKLAAASINKKEEHERL